MIPWFRHDGVVKKARRLPSGQSFYTDNASPLRSAVERVSARPLVFAHQLPRWAVPFALVALLLAGLALPPVAGVVALGVLGVLLCWLAFLSWPAMTAQNRLLRVVALVVLVMIAVGRLVSS